VEAINAAHVGKPDKNEKGVLQLMRRKHRKIVQGQW